MSKAWDDEAEWQLELPFEDHHGGELSFDSCSCESWTLFNFGCKCGYMEREKRRKELEKMIEELEKKREEERKKKKFADDDLPF